MKLTPREAMLMAIEEGHKGAGFVSPNPLVGCVILDAQNQLLAKGYHARVGEAHAEINALNSISDPARLKGAHVYVTLEPCAHVGRTGSCAQALAKLPIASVTFGLLDPFPLVAGKGVEILRQAGKIVQQSTELHSELEDLAEVFLLNQRAKKTFVALKVASSLDGQIALRNGESRWITGEAARQHVHYLRGTYDAALTGVGTILNDNPRLNSRDPRFSSRAQKLIILDPKGELFTRLGSLALNEVRANADIILVTGIGVRVPSGYQHLEQPVQDDGTFALPALLSALFEQKIYSLFVEAGSYTASSFLRAGVVDRLYLYLAPKLLGLGLGWSSAFQLDTLDQAPVLTQVQVKNFGPDLLVTGRLSP